MGRCGGRWNRNRIYWSRSWGKRKTTLDSGRRWPSGHVQTYEGKKDIMLWVYLGTKKRNHTHLILNHPPRLSMTCILIRWWKQKRLLMTLKPIMEIAILESSITCGHTIQMRKHHSHDNAPDKPFLRGSKSKKPSVPRESTHTTPTTSTSGNSSPIPTGISPACFITLLVGEKLCRVI